MNEHTGWKNYILAFVITVGIFATVIVSSRMITSQKIDSIKDAQDSIAIDIMSSETEFSLLSELSCKNIGASSLVKELGSMEEKIQYSETNKIGNKEDLTKLKKYYFLLEIKDFLLMEKINERCGKRTTSILYIYTTAQDCNDCIKQGYALTALREKYPDLLRIYSFDYNTELSALHALLSVYKVNNEQFPALVIGEKVHTGFNSLEDIEKLIPAVVKAQQDKEKKEAQALLDEGKKIDTPSLINN